MSTAVARRSTLAGVRSHHGTDPDMALRYHPASRSPACFSRRFELSLDQFWGIVTSRRTLNALKISFGLSFAAALRQSGDGNDHRLGAGALSLSGPAAVRRHRRYSLCAADRGRRRRADAIVRAKGLARRAAGRTRHQGRVHADRHLHRDGLHRHSLRGADGAAGADRSRSSRSRRRPPASAPTAGTPCSG